MRTGRWESSMFEVAANGGWALAHCQQQFLADSNGVLFPRDWLKRQDLSVLSEHAVGQFDGEPVYLLEIDGTLAALIETIEQPDHLLIENVAVLPERQGQGLGRRLLALAEDVGRAQGYGEIRLYTNKLFAENIELYRRLGYRIDREEQNERGTAVHMSKRL